MAFTWETLYSFFAPPASRNPSSQGPTSSLSSAFSSFKSADRTATGQPTDHLPMPPSSAVFARGGATSPLSPAESTASSSSAATSDSERDYFPPTAAAAAAAPYSHPTASTSTLATTATNSSATSTTSLHIPQSQPQRTHATIPTTINDNNNTTASGPPDIMSRAFPPPAADLPSLDELLARPPGRHSLRHWVRNARETDAGAVAAGMEAERLRWLEKVKGDLRRAKEEFDARGVGKF